MNNVGRVMAPVAVVMLLGALSGCASGCGASPEKLAALRRGMSYDETTRIMGCQASVVAGGVPTGAGYSIVEWDGPSSRIFDRTRIDFLDGKLLSYSTELRGAL